MDRFHVLAETVKEKISTGPPSLNSIFHTTHGVLELAQKIKDEENPCIGLLTMTAELVLGIEKKGASESLSGLYNVSDLNLNTLSGTLDKIRALVSRIKTSRHLVHFVNYDIAWLQRQLEEEAMMFEVSIEYPPSQNISLPSDVEFRLFVSDIKIGGPLAPHTSNWSAYDIRTFIASMGVKDLTRRVQTLGNRPVAYGGKSSMWLGRLDGSQVAMKVMDIPMASGTSSLIGSFIHDAIVWSCAMHHENILPLLGVAQLGNSVALVSPWMELGAIHQCLADHPEVSVGSLIADVARGLSYLHARGIVYRNLHFSTVLVSGIGRAYLSGFYFASFYQEIRSHGATSRPLAAGRMLEDDVFAFGRLMLKPFNSHSIARTIKTAKHDDGHLLKGIGGDLWPIIQICMHEDPKQRPSIFEVASKVVHLAEESLFPTPSSALKTPRALIDISKEIRRRDEHPITGGGASDLYLGERKGAKVALKLIRFFGMNASDKDVAHRRFKREASLWASLRHPRILELYGICNHGPGALFMVQVTPWLKNGTIIEYLSTVQPDANRTALLAQAAEGLLYLHNRNPPVVHGDLKGSNILITNLGTAVLADFGLSKPNNETTTTMLQGAGSPRWMAPELLEVGVDRPVKSQKSDIYAFGHVILEVLSGKLPFFHLRDDIHVIVEIINGGRSPRPNGIVADTWINDSAWTLCQECTAIDADSRPDILTINNTLHDFTGLYESHSFLE